MTFFVKHKELPLDVVEVSTSSISPKLTVNFRHHTDSHFTSLVVKSPGRVRITSSLPSCDNKECPK